jgi:hypothetical protein
MADTSVLPVAAPVKSEPANPANVPQTRVTEATRIPMSLPQLKMSVPEIPGYYLYWFLGQNVPRALRAGYEFVNEWEVNPVSTDLAGDANSNGNTDMGTRVSIVAGGVIEGTAEPQRHYLMKLRQEWRDSDVEKLGETNERIAAALRGGAPMPGQPTAPGETPHDQLQRYLKKGQDLFIPKKR